MSALRILLILCRWLGPRRVLRMLCFRAGRRQLRHDFAACRAAERLARHG